MPSNTPEYSRIHYQYNKRIFTNCACGRKVSNPNLKKHLSSVFHTNFINGIVQPSILNAFTEADNEFIECGNCGLNVMKSKMDLHLITVKCKNTKK